MAKLGKKARKFAKKHLQSVLKKRRKTKVLFKKRVPKNGKNDVEEEVENSVGLSNGRSTEYEGFDHNTLDSVFTENDKDEVADASESDGYLSEDSSCQNLVESESTRTADEIATSTYTIQNEKIHADLAIQKNKLDRLRKKDPEFSKFLESFISAETFQDDVYSVEGDSSDEEALDDDDLTKVKPKLFTSGSINTWCQMVTEGHSQSALINLLNAYRAACHYGNRSIGHMIENSESFCKVVLFTLSNADDIFRGLLQLSSNSTKELLELKKTSKWKSLKPLVKSFLRSTLFLLNQVTDSDILTFAITRLRASMIFFVSFPSLIQPLVKATVHLWATGGRILSSASFLVIRDVASMFSSNYFDTCLAKTFIAFTSQSRVTEIADIQHIQFLRDCVVELSSLDVPKSSAKAVASISQLAKILSWGLETKKKDAMRKICSWEYVNCIDLWVRFISANIRDYDLQSLFFANVQIINSLAHMFPGPRYFPIRLKCIEWLNHLSSSSGNFFPIASLVLDILEYKVAKEGKKARIALNISSVLKLPKHHLKSKIFQDVCFHTAVEQLALHFAQWCNHIAFPDLATISLIRLRKVYEITTIESSRRMLRRLIEQVEQNVDFVQKKRDDVSFSPHDQQSVDSFLQLEKASLNTPFSQYYRSVLEKAAERKLQQCGEMSLPRNLKRNRTEPKRKPGAAAQNVYAEDHQNGISS